MKHVNAYPFVGKDYEKGFLNSGKKVLILGHSHYDADSAGCPCHHSFTIEMMDGFLSGEDGAYYKGFTSQTKALLNREISVDDRGYVWNQVAFYNFIQFNLEAPGVKETDEQFNDSIPAFKEVLEELKPDVIIVWGYGLFDRLYGLGETDGEEMSLTNGDKVYTRWFSTGGEDKALMIRQHHPSRSYSWCEWAKVFQDLFKN
ncbi:MAG: hypothetical protein JTJ18_06300 [Streptococcus sp.]|nr:hypothetical protein [Streptococcus sp.]